MTFIYLRKYLVKHRRKENKQSNKLKYSLIRYHPIKLHYYHNTFMTTIECYKYQATKAAI